MLIKCNDKNTSIDESSFKIYEKEYGEMITREIQDETMKAIDQIPFIKNLISPDRSYASMLKRYSNPNEAKLEELIEDPKGRIRVDLANPHILEGMRYFTATRDNYEKTGKFTAFRPSNNPKSDYRKFWKQEIKRCWYGYVRESDGEWISGNNYFYWNFGIIMVAVTVKGTKRSDRASLPPSLYDGDYWFFHYLERARDQGKHTAVLKARGLGYSFKGAAMLGRNFVLGENYTARSKTNNIALANEKEYLIKDAILNKFTENLDFLSDTTPFPSRRDSKNTLNGMHWIMSYFKGDSKTEYGTKNQVMGVTLKNDPEKARGKRSNLIIWEEAGKFDSFLKAWGIARPSVEHNGYAFGIMLAFGTGGTEGAAFDGLKEIFYKPVGYNILPITNVFDKGAKAESLCSFFHGRYLNYEGCMDENGNSDVVKAMMNIMETRVITKYNVEDSNTLPQEIAENPITPQEAIMQTTGNFFPIIEVRNYLEECRSDVGMFVEHHKVGRLNLTDNDQSVEFEEDWTLKPIRSYTPGKANTEGAIEIFSEPESIRGEIERFRYIAGIDPIDNDYIKNGSLGSIFVMDRYTEQIVAEYTGRPQRAEEFYETCRRLLIYYNAEANYESNIKGMFGYFDNKNSLHLLCNTPQWLKDSNQVKATLSGRDSKGTRATEEINNEGLRLQKSWMLGNFVENDGSEENSTLMLRKIRSLGYLEELYAHNDKGNFDRISAMGLLLILKKSLERIIRQDFSEEYIEEDAFINANFDERFKGGELGLFKEERKPNLFKKELMYE